MSVVFGLMPLLPSSPFPPFTPDEVAFVIDMAFTDAI